MSEGGMSVMDVLYAQISALDASDGMSDEEFERLERKTRAITSVAKQMNSIRTTAHVRRHQGRQGHDQAVRRRDPEVPGRRERWRNS